jgi:hypothetical protein
MNFVKDIHHEEPDLVVLVFQVVNEEQVHLVFLVGVVGDVGVVASEVGFPHEVLGEPVLHILQFYGRVLLPCVPQGIRDGAEEFAIDLSDGGILSGLSDILYIILA